VNRHQNPLLGMIYAVHKLSRKVLNWGYKVHNAAHRVLHRCWFSLAHYIFASTLSDHHHLSVQGLWGVEGEGVDSKLQHRQELLWDSSSSFFLGTEESWDSSLEGWSCKNVIIQTWGSLESLLVLFISPKFLVGVDYRKEFCGFSRAAWKVKFCGIWTSTFFLLSVDLACFCSLFCH